ncbi:MAG TPA: hypothetical protein VMF08_02995 [Candidatus Sulfotelmatobacter sp.]|nr:hypothetical protein [Candidatus Sulfotelmatobacter sp.]
MSKATSPYYPPRARWYAPVFRVFAATRLTMAMDRIRLPNAVTWGGLALSFLVPGLGFYLRGPRIYGHVAMSACGLMFLLFIAFFGHSIGNLAFGMIISTHVSAIAYYCGPILQSWTLRMRFLFTILTLLAVSFLFYGPLRDMIQNHILMPLRINGRVIVVEKLAPMGTIRRGDWIAYRISRYSEYGDDEYVHVHSGTGFGPVLGVAGDNVVFSTNGFLVNGVLHPPLPDMPSSGSLVVAEKHWFIWPSYSVSGHGYQSRITSMMLELANVSEDQYAGRPFKHWFWNEQVIK